LNIETTDVKETYEKIPSLSFIYKPSIPSKTLLDNTRKEEMIQQLMHYESVVGTLQDAKDRLVDREGCYQRKTFKPEGVTSRTKAHIDKELKDIVIENLTKKYGQVTIGIHGQELPKYTEGTKEWWMNNLGFKENP
jgi:soluble P-type ATPase